MDFPKHEFREDHLSVSNGWVKCLSVAWKARVEKVVGVEEDGSLTDDIRDPDRPVWFLMDCMSRSGASFSVVYDGETWIPVRRGADQRLAKDIKPKPSINLDQICVRDKEIFDAAIQAFKSSD